MPSQKDLSLDYLEQLPWDVTLVPRIAERMGLSDSDGPDVADQSSELIILSEDAQVSSD